MNFFALCRPSLLRRKSLEEVLTIYIFCDADFETLFDDCFPSYETWRKEELSRQEAWLNEERHQSSDSGWDFYDLCAPHSLILSITRSHG